jgi:hypothetical protein
MIFITENAINQIIEKYEEEEHYLNDLKWLIKNQPELMAFINQENHTLLTEEEVALLEYLTVVIYFSISTHYNHLAHISRSEIEKDEESNWEIFNQATSKNFTKILDLFFLNHPQEDLLALVEDSLLPDDENPVTLVGREIIFVACKSIIDAMHRMLKTL